MQVAPAPGRERGRPRDDEPFKEFMLAKAEARRWTAAQLAQKLRRAAGLYLAERGRRAREGVPLTDDDQALCAWFTRLLETNPRTRRDLINWETMTKWMKRRAERRERVLTDQAAPERSVEYSEAVSAALRGPPPPLRILSGPPRIMSGD